MEQNLEWSQDFAARIGQRVAHLRARLDGVEGRKFSTQALADRTAQLGHPLDRSVIAKLEKGHRQSISVPELLVLAHALGVPPLMLVLPLGQDQAVEVLPGRTVAVTDALRWLTGENPLPGDAWDDLATSTIPSFQVHQQNVERWENSRLFAQMIRDGVRPGTEQDIEHLNQQGDRAIQGLRGVRHMMRARGLTPPPLPPGIPLVDEGGES